MNFRRGGIIFAFSGFDSKIIQKEGTMKKIWLVVLLAVFVLGMVPVMVAAQAVVIKDDRCTFFDLNGDPLEVFEGSEDLNSVKVITQSANCNRNVSCHTEIYRLA